MDAQSTSDISWLLDLFNSTEAVATVEPAAPVVPVVPVVTKRACLRCGGSGRIPNFSHVKGGECFRCHGSGFYNV